MSYSLRFGHADEGARSPEGLRWHVAGARKSCVFCDFGRFARPNKRYWIVLRVQGNEQLGAQLDSSASAMDDPNRCDRVLYRQPTKGHEGAFCTLYEKYQGPMFRFAWHMSGNNATAEDVTQDVFMQLIRNPNGYDPAKGSVAGYLFGIARNLT